LAATCAALRVAGITQWMRVSDSVHVSNASGQLGTPTPSAPATLEARVALSENLTDGVYVNQSAAFSDFHEHGRKPAANASLTDGNFVAGRFVVVQLRRHLAGDE